MLSFFPRGVLDEILNLIESVSEGFSFLLLEVWEVIFGNFLEFVKHLFILNRILNGATRVYCLFCYINSISINIGTRILF